VLCGLLLSAALLALAGSCHGLIYDRNSGFCCEDPARCEEWGAPGPIACENPGEVCDIVQNRCVRAECSGDQECTDPALAVCTRGRCESCVDDSSCAHFENTPICDGGACRACRLGDCASGVCDTATGACVAESDVVYVSKTGQDSGTCTYAAPCLSIGRGLDQLGARRWLHVAASVDVYAETAAMPGAGVQISGKMVTIIGPGATLTTTRNGDVALLVEGASTVVVEGLSIANAGGTSGDGVACRNVGLASPMLTLRSVEVKNNGGRGVNAATCTLTVERSTIANNPGGGIQTTGSTVAVERSTIAGNPGGGVSLSGGSTTILNNMIVANGSATSVFAGISIGQISAGTPVLAFNTITANSGASGIVTGLACNQVTIPLVFSNNIVYGNQVSGSGTQVGGNNCSYTYSDIGPQTVAGTGNINIDPIFVDAANGNYHLQAGSPAKNAADPGVTIAVDIDGDLRPQGGRSDMGADEVAE
jgi:parallel beta helix pectate lyase-like protein